MNISTSEKILNYKESYTPSTHRAYYGAYLNSVINNIENVNKAFEAHFNIKFDSIANTNISDIDLKRYIDFISAYFPVLGLLHSEKGCPGQLDILRRLYVRMNELRNYFTHPFHKDLASDSNASLNLILDEVISRTASIVKEKRMKSDKTKELLKSSLSKELNVWVEIRIKELQKTANELKKLADCEEDVTNKTSLLKRSKAILTSTNNRQDMINGVFNDSFRHLLYYQGDKLNRTVKLNNRYKATPNNTSEYYGGVESKIGISINGLIFVMCCFLSKKEGEDFRAKLKYFKSKVNSDTSNQMTSLGFMATHWVFSYNAFKGLRHRMNTLFTKETLLSQIVDELSKVPDVVYRNMTSRDKTSFLEDINEFIQEFDDPKTIESSKVVHPVIRKRYEDKFVYFVLRYLDEFANFPSLRFQVHFANYIKDKREKKLESLNVVTDREVKEKVCAFGKLSVIQDARDKALSKCDCSAIGWQEFPNSSYNLIGENIPIYFNGNALKQLSQEDFNQRNKVLSGCLKSRLYTPPKESKKRCLLESLVKSVDIVYAKPTFLLSKYELTALLYELLVLHKTPLEIEHTLLQKIDAKINLLNELASATSYTDELKSKVKESDLPKQFKRAIVDTKWEVAEVTKDYDKIERQITKELVTTNERIEEHKSAFKAVEDKILNRYKNSEKGRLATWLADDIKRMMLQKNREQWKSYMHVHLQRSLAFFDDPMQLQNKETFLLVKDFFKFDKYNKFIEEALIQPNFEAMYLAYLNGRLAYLEYLMKNAVLLKKNSNELDERLSSFFYKRTYQIQPLKELALKIMNHPILLSRGVFDDKPTYFKNGEYSVDDDTDKFAAWYIYARKTKDIQAFYTKELAYSEGFKELYDVEAKGNEIRKYEIEQNKEIRRVRTQDIFLKLVLDDIYRKLFNHKITIDLNDIYISREKRDIEALEADKQHKKVVGDKSEPIYKESSLWSKNFTVTYSKDKLLMLHREWDSISKKEDYLLVDEHVKLRDVGKYKYLLTTDEKVTFLLNYLPIIDGVVTPKPWNKELIEFELDRYKFVRYDKVLQICQSLEYKLLKRKGFDGVNYPDDFKFNGHPNFRKVIGNGLLKSLVCVDCDKDNLSKFAGTNIVSKGDVVKTEQEEWIFTDIFSSKDVFYDDCTNEAIKRGFMVTLIRNKFSHNQYPPKEFMDIMIEEVKQSGVDLTECKSYTDYILKYLEQAISSLLSLPQSNATES